MKCGLRTLEGMGAVASRLRFRVQHTLISALLVRVPTHHKNPSSKPQIWLDINLMRKSVNSSAIVYNRSWAGTAGSYLQCSYNRARTPS